MSALLRDFEKKKESQDELLSVIVKAQCPLFSCLTQTWCDSYISPEFVLPPVKCE